MKHKNLTKEQIIISLDRLTRFKNTKEKYFRVFSDVLLNCLIEPQLRKSDLERMDYTDLTSIAEKILNDSIIAQYLNESESINTPNLLDLDTKFDINSLISYYENSIFINDEETQKLLNNKIYYIYASHFITENSPVNLKWLKTIINNNCNDLKTLRKDFYLKYPIEKVVLAEGITEEILLPAFSKFLGLDFYQKGIQIIPAGGKNQVVKMYYKLIEELKLPIFILLDKDAEENIRQITPKLRNIDKIHLVSCGEFEDLLPKSLIVKTVNKHFENFLSITEKDLISENPTAKTLEELFKTRGLHEFKKADFAKLVKENITETSDVSSEIVNIIKELS